MHIKQSIRALGLTLLVSSAAMAQLVPGPSNPKPPPSSPSQPPPYQPPSPPPYQPPPYNPPSPPPYHPPPSPPPYYPPPAPTPPPYYPPPSPPPYYPPPAPTPPPYYPPPSPPPYYPPPSPPPYYPPPAPTPPPYYPPPSPPYYPPTPDPDPYPYPSPTPTPDPSEDVIRSVTVNLAVKNKVLDLAKWGLVNDDYSGYEVVAISGNLVPNSPAKTVVQLIADGVVVASQTNPGKKLRLVPNDTIVWGDITTLKLKVIGSTKITNLSIRLR